MRRRRLLVLRGRPARIACEVAVPFPRPRSADVRTTEAFRGLEAQVRLALGP